jgi:hypothetical protein
MLLKGLNIDDQKPNISDGNSKPYTTTERHSHYYSININGIN